MVTNMRSARLSQRSRDNRISTLDKKRRNTSTAKDKAHQRSLQAKKRRLERDRQRHRTAGWEAGVATVVNVAILVAVTIGGVRLVPMAQTQRRNLSQLRESVTTIETRVEALREKVELGIDPLQAEAAMTEYLNYLPPQRMEVDLIDPSTSVSSTDE